MLPLSTMQLDYYEIDHSAMAHQQQKFLEEWEKSTPTFKFAQYCEEFPWAVECKIYED